MLSFCLVSRMVCVHGLVFYLLNLLDVSMHFCDACLSMDFVTAS